MAPGSPQSRRLAVLLFVAAVLFGVGIWRVHPHMLLGDEASTIAQAIEMAFQHALTTQFDHGGNLYIRLVSITIVPLAAYWSVTGDRTMAEGSAVYSHDKPWAESELLFRFYDVTVAGRLLTVCFGIATVAVVYLLARELSDDRGGLVAAVALLGSAGFVVTAKWATEDVPQSFMLVVVLYLLVRALRSPPDGSRTWVTYAAVAIGIAGSVKATSIAIVPTVLVAIAWIGLRDGREWRYFVTEPLSVGVIAATVYVLGTPSIIFAPEAYVSHILSKLAYFSGGGESSLVLATYPDPNWLVVLGFLASMLGLPLLVAAAIMLAVVGAGVSGGVLDRRVGLVLLMIGTYGALLTTGSFAAIFRVIPLLPLLAVVVGVGVVAALEQWRPSRPPVVHLLVAGILCFSLANTAVAVGDWNTSRQEATDWLQDHPERVEDVDVYSHRIYLPEFPAESVVRRHRDAITGSATERRAALARVTDRCAETVVASSFHYFRYLRSPQIHPEIASMYRTLFDEEGYRISKTFGPPITTRYTAERRFEEAPRLIHRGRPAGNPVIVVFERVGAPGEGCEDA